MFTIKGKKFTKFDINVKCAELLGSKSARVHINGAHMPSLRDCVMTDFGVKDYCNKITDTEVIIDKCWSMLMCTWSEFDSGDVMWDTIMRNHDCSKLVAACILFIEENEK